MKNSHKVEVDREWFQISSQKRKIAPKYGTGRYKKLYIIKKVLVIGLLVCVTLQSSLLSVLAKTEVNNLYVLTESGNKIEVTKYTVNGYEQIRLVDHEGNYLEFGTDDDFFEYNGETVEF